MRVNTDTDGFKIDKIKSSTEYKFDKKQEDKYYEKQIDEVLEKYVEDEFEYAKIIVNIKDIYSKYFDDKSMKNITKEEKYNLNNEDLNKKEYIFKSNGDINYESLFNMDDLEIELQKPLENSSSPEDVVINMKEFISEYNSLIEKVKVKLSENKNNKKINIKGKQEKEYEISKLKYNSQEKEKKLKQFMSEVQSNIISVVNEMGGKINKVGIRSYEGSQELKLGFNENKYKKAIEVNGRDVYLILVGTKEDEYTPIKQFEKVFKKYSNTFDSIFINGLKIIKSKEKTMSLEEIKKQEDEIRRLMDKMNKKENELGSRFNMLKFNLDQCDKQIESFI